MPHFAVAFKQLAVGDQRRAHAVRDADVEEIVLLPPDAEIQLTQPRRLHIVGDVDRVREMPAQEIRDRELFNAVKARNIGNAAVFRVHRADRCHADAADGALAAGNERLHEPAQLFQHRLLRFDLAQRDLLAVKQVHGKITDRAVDPAAGDEHAQNDRRVRAYTQHHRRAPRQLGVLPGLQLLNELFAEKLVDDVRDRHLRQP